MNRVAAIILALIIALVAITAPVMIAIDQSRKSGIEIEKGRMRAYARDVIRRSNDTATQVDIGVNKLIGTYSKDPCSDRNLAIMREIDLSSSYIQTMGHVVNDHMICSSLGMESSLYLGPVDLTTPRAKVRLNVKLPFSGDSTFIVIERDGFAAIIHKNLPIDATTDEADVSLATFSLFNNQVLSSRGVIKPEWIEGLKNKQEVTYYKDGYIVTVVKSDKYLIGALAALPVSYLDQRERSIAMTLVPVGLLAGLILAFAVYFLAKQQMGMPTALKSALRRKEFFLVYQPVVNLQTGKWVGVEALLRWKRSNGDMVRPDLFIPIAEECGLIQLITKRVMEIVAQDAGELIRRHPDFHIAINLSPADLHSKHIVKLLSNLMQDVNARPENLIIEATERGILKEGLAKEVVEEIRANGVRVAIDDFGTGYSSLSYLETFKVDYLKIDKSFIDSLGTDAPTSHVVSHIIEMAKALELEMVAEGVETEAQAQFLRDHGVQYAQGWLFAKPMTASEILINLIRVTSKPI